MSGRSGRERTRTPDSISVVIPCYNEEEVLDSLRLRLDGVLRPLGVPYEVVLVDDGSRDSTWLVLSRIQQEDPHYKVIRLSKNCGHQMALTCGLDHCNGEVVLIIDADLQDPPELLPTMIAKWQEGYDVVYGKRVRRAGEAPLKLFFAFAFYRVMRRLTGVDIPEDTGDFRLMDRRAVKALCQLREKHRFVRGMVSWIGFPQTFVAYDRAERYAGTTKYPFKKSLLLAIDAITSFSTAPLRVATYLGTVLAGLSALYILVVFVLHVGGHNLPGYTSMMAVMLLLGGVELMVLGVIGEYIGRIFEQGQARPLYFVSDIQGEPLASRDRDTIQRSKAVNS